MDETWNKEQGSKVSLAYPLVSVNLTDEIFWVILFGLENRSSKHKYQLQYYDVVVVVF